MVLAQAGCLYTNHGSSVCILYGVQQIQYVLLQQMVLAQAGCLNTTDGACTLDGVQQLCTTAVDGASTGC